MINNKKTMIQISKTTADAIKKLKITPSESYDQILKRMIDAELYSLGTKA